MKFQKCPESGGYGGYGMVWAMGVWWVTICDKPLQPFDDRMLQRGRTSLLSTKPLSQPHPSNIWTYRNIQTQSRASLLPSWNVYQYSSCWRLPCGNDMADSSRQMSAVPVYDTELAKWREDRVVPPLVVASASKPTTASVAAWTWYRSDKKRGSRTWKRLDSTLSSYSMLSI